MSTSLGALKSAWIRSSLPSSSLSNDASTHTSPLYQSAGLVEKTACARPLTNVGTAGAWVWVVTVRGASADAGLVTTAATRMVAAPAPARSRLLMTARLTAVAQQIEPLHHGGATAGTATAWRPASRLR